MAHKISSMSIFFSSYPVKRIPGQNPVFILNFEDETFFTEIIEPFTLETHEVASSLGASATYPVEQPTIGSKTKEPTSVIRAMSNSRSTNVNIIAEIAVRYSVRDAVNTKAKYHDYVS